jgi:hypothetical protein
LTPAQRRGALRRLRSAARLGKGPRLPGPGVALAVAMDTAKSTARNGIAAVRCHPAGSLFLTALLASVIVCYVFFVSVSIRLIPIPPAQGALPALRGATAGGAQGQPGSAAGPGGQQVSGPAPSSTPASGASAHASAHASARASARSSGAGPSQLAASPVPLSPSSLVPSASPSPDPLGVSPTPSSSGGDPGGLCVDVGPLGVCLSVSV